MSAIDILYVVSTIIISLMVGAIGLFAGEYTAENTINSLKEELRQARKDLIELSKEPEEQEEGQIVIKEVHVNFYNLNNKEQEDN